MKPEPLIISIHMPKTAGSSFRATLEEYYRASFRHDYADFPLNQAPELRIESAQEAQQAALPKSFESARCVHGHFLPMKYLGLAEQRDCKFVTWFREPLSRLVSHYHYWHFAYEQTSPMTAALHRRVVEEEWTLEKFCLSPELRNVYSQFLDGFPVERLDFIGITEFYDADLRYFSDRYLCENVTPHILNKRSEKVANLSEKELGPEFWAEVAAFHAEDIELYEMALALRSERKSH